MSRTSWGNGLIDALEQIGVLDRKQAEAVMAVKEEHPDEATGDLVVKMGLATEDDVARAIEALKTGDGNVSSDLLVEGMRRASSRLASAARASLVVASVAAGIVEKKG